jgi:hypothetical protein
MLMAGDAAEAGAVAIITGAETTVITVITVIMEDGIVLMGPMACTALTDIRAPTVHHP